MTQCNSKYFFFCHSEIRNPKSKIRNGFTLLELLISLTIIGLVLVIVFGSLRIGARAWEKGEADVEVHQRQRIVLDLIKRQIASTCVREMKDGDLPPFFLRGDSKSMEFISRIPMVPTNQVGMVYVKYMAGEGDKAETKRLISCEKNIIFLDKEKDMGDLDEDDCFELIPGARDISFEYLKAQTGEEASEWQQSWDPEDDKGLPLAVKIIFKESEETDPIYVLARIESEV